MKINLFSSERLSQANYTVRGIAILLVVLGHIASPFTQTIYSFHMPLFFILSGFYLSQKPKTLLLLEQHIQYVLKRIMIPFALFGILGLFAELLKNTCLAREGISVLEGLYGLTFWMNYEHLSHYGFILWFLPALFWARVGCLSLTLISNPVLRSISVLMIAFISTQLPRLPFALDIGVCAILFVYLGKQLNSLLHYLEQKGVMALLFVFILCGGIIVWMPTLSVNMAMNTFEHLGLTALYSFAIALVSICACCLVSLPWLAYIGAQSMLIYAFHPYTNNIAHLGVQTYPWGNWFFKWLVSLVILSGILWLSRLLKKQYPQSRVLSYV